MNLISPKWALRKRCCYWIYRLIENQLRINDNYHQCTMVDGINILSCYFFLVFMDFTVLPFLPSFFLQVDKG